MKNSVYICYSKIDVQYAYEIKRFLEDNDVIVNLVEKNKEDYLIDDTSIILNNIKNSDIFLLIFTNNVNSDNLVSIQIIKAVSLNKKSFAIKFNNAKLDDNLKFSMYNFRFINHNEKDKLLKEIKQHDE